MRAAGGLILCALALCLPWGCNGSRGSDAGNGGREGPGKGLDVGPPLEIRAAWSPDIPVEQLPESSRVKGDLEVPLQKQWRYVILHHSGTHSGSESSFDRYHREQKGWKGVGYHFVIGNGNGSPDGCIEVTFRWQEQMSGAHAGVNRYNRHGIGICLVGDFTEGEPTVRQMKSLVALVTYLQRRCGIPTPNILLHRQVKQTRCPGENFPYAGFLSLLNP